MRIRWLVEPKNEHTNEVISLLRPGEQISEVKLTIAGNKTKKIKVWQVTFRDLTFLESSKRKGLIYQAYSQKDGGKIQPYPYLLNKRSMQKRRAALRTMSRQLKEIPGE